MPKLATCNATLSLSPCLLSFANLTLSNHPFFSSPPSASYLYTSLRRLSIPLRQFSSKTRRWSCRERGSLW
ncbi:hypothetical protein BDZ85DRAFT_269722 [Elsinoe ampelina]|uniref:Uncharacterized protein n=1 Tax=Elsinoe ampelina TaxID=302913 RepID=A0A6A6FZ85_9PEZI|nr:hypothetical protein BDZ85DRAFT_269722 [Elsinoe ampelina]